MDLPDTLTNNAHDPAAPANFQATPKPSRGVKRSGACDRISATLAFEAVDASEAAEGDVTGSGVAFIQAIHAPCVAHAG
jgi:hypothetical protein